MTVIDITPGAPIKPYLVPASAEAEHEPTPEEAIAVVVAVEGNLDLAAERLYGPCEGYTNRARLTALLASDSQVQQELQRVLRTLTMLQAFSTFRLASITTDATLEKMDANTRGRFMIQLLNVMAVLTDDHTQTVNSKNTSLNLSLTEAVLKSLPPDVQQALKVIEAEVVTEDPSTDGVGEQGWSIGNPPPNAARSDGRPGVRS